MRPVEGIAVEASFAARSVGSWAGCSFPALEENFLIAG
jgi:hypothetical protein